MPYQPDRAWSDLERDIQNQSRQLIDQLKRGKELNEELRVFADGRSAADIAQDLGQGVTVAHIQDANAAIAAMSDLHDAADNALDLSQANYFDLLRKFT